MDPRTSSLDVPIQAVSSRTASGLISIDGVDKQSITCPLSLCLFFDPVLTIPCGHALENKEKSKLSDQKCPCCREPKITGFIPALDKKEMMGKVLNAHPELYAEVYFNLDHFAEVVSRNELNSHNPTPTGERFIKLLRYAPEHLTEKAPDGVQKGKTVLDILVSTEQGRQVLRDKLNQVITLELLRLEVNGKALSDWLIVAAPSSNGLFAAEQGLQPLRYPPRRSLTDVWQCAAYGDEAGVLQRLRANPDLATEKGTACDFVSRIFRDQTCYQIALRGLPDNDLIKGIKDIYLAAHPGSEGQAELDRQYNEVFPQGRDAYIAAQKANVIDFMPVYNAIKNASPADVKAALAKQGNGSALCRVLNEYRVSLMQKMLSEDYNPYHFEKVAELYEAKFDELDSKDLLYDHPDRYIYVDLFWRQVIGPVQFYDSARMGQVRCTGLGNMVDNHVPVKRDFKLRNYITNQDVDYFSDSNPASRFGLDFAVYSYFGCARACSGGEASAALDSSQIFQDFCRATTADFKILCPEHPFSAGARPTV